MKRILVTGSNGQLGQSLKSLTSKNNFEVVFLSKDILNITDSKSIDNILKEKFDFCINCAAYTAVDKAEEEKELAYKINVLAPKLLAQACKKYETTLIHVSTDFVFNGEYFRPYLEDHKTHPISKYGETKLEGEIAIKSVLENFYIIRTSWLYSEFGNNFMKSMINLSKNRDELNIVADQIGTPTYAVDLAATIFKIIESQPNYGVYHYSNEGSASWYDFAKAIFEYSKIQIKVNPIPSTSYPTPAKRPYFSVLDKTKIKTNFNITIPYWRESLQKSLKALV